MLSLDTLLPSFDVVQLAQDAKALPGYRAFVASGMVFSLALVCRFLALLWRVQRGEHVSWIAPILHLCVLALVLRHYGSIAGRTVQYATWIGQPAHTGESLSQLSALRAEGLDAFLAERPALGQSVFTWSEAEVFVLVVSSLLLQLACSAGVLVLQSVQTFLIAALVTYGPIVLAFSLFGGAFVSIARTWLLALLEVCSWSWLLGLMTALFAPSLTQALPMPFQLVTDVAISSVLLGLLLAIPLSAAALFRGHATKQCARHASQAVASRVDTWLTQLPARWQPSSSARPGRE